jgi:C_GCAxxG_C_C family probable redox protein
MSDKTVSKVELAVATFGEGFNCSQAVLSAFAPDLGLDRETALRVSGAFGAGIARMGQTCGAVSGALMVLGFKYSQVEAGDKPAKEKMYAIAREFMARFEARNGSILCRELLGYDISTPEGMQLIREKGLFVSLCPKLVGDAIEIVEGLV